MLLKWSQNLLRNDFFKSLLTDGFSITSIPTTEQFNQSHISLACNIWQCCLNCLLVHEICVMPAASSLVTSFSVIEEHYLSLMQFGFLHIYVGYFLPHYCNVVDYITKIVKALIIVPVLFSSCEDLIFFIY